MKYVKTLAFAIIAWVFINYFAFHGTGSKKPKPRNNRKNTTTLWMTSATPLQVNHVSGFVLKWFDNEGLIQSMRELDKDLQKVKVYGAFEAFQSLIPWAYKADIWRYAVLWRYGGVYMDHECKPTEDLSRIVHTLTQNDSFHTCSDTGAIGGIRKKLWQGFIIANKGEDAMLRALQIAIQNVKEKKYIHPLDITGPGVMRQAVPGFKPMCKKEGLGGGKLVYDNDKKTFMRLDQRSKRSDYARAVNRHRVYRYVPVL